MHSKNKSVFPFRGFCLFKYNTLSFSSDCSPPPQQKEQSFFLLSACKGTAFFAYVQIFSTKFWENLNIERIAPRFLVLRFFVFCSRLFYIPPRGYVSIKSNKSVKFCECSFVKIFIYQKKVVPLHPKSKNTPQK